MMKILRVIIAGVVAACLVPPAPAAAADDAAGRRKELQRVKREMERKKREILQSRKQERSVLQELERLERAARAGDAELARQEQLLRDAEGALRRTEGTATGLQGRLGPLRELYRSRVRALYKMSRSGAAGSIASADSGSDMLKRVKYLGMVAERDRQVIATYRSSLTDLRDRRAEIERQRDETVARRRAVEAKRAELAAEREEKRTLLANARKQRDLYEQTLKELEESSASLWAMIKKAQEDRRRAARQAKRKEQERERATEASMTPASGARVGQGKLPWPAKGPVVTEFGIRRHPRFGTSTFQRGIEIEAPKGSVVTAVSDGRVAYADWYKGYGQLVIVEHDGGLYSLYGHLERIDVASGDAVRQGQAIGLVGDTGSLQGSRLYFEMRRNGEAEDPLAWLAKQ